MTFYENLETQSHKEELQFEARLKHFTVEQLLNEHKQYGNIVASLNHPDSPLKDMDHYASRMKRRYEAISEELEARGLVETSASLR